MGGRIRYTKEFKLGAVAQVTDKGHSVTSVAGRLGVSTKSLYDWAVKKFCPSEFTIDVALLCLNTFSRTSPEGG